VVEGWPSAGSPKCTCQFQTSFREKVAKGKNE